MARWIGLVVVLTATAAVATPLRHRRHINPAPPTQDHRASEFYPQHIDGGVTGNLPFNNQIRKLTDPLNANGAGG